MSTVITSHQSVVGDGKGLHKRSDQLLFGSGIGVEPFLVRIELRFGRGYGEKGIDKQGITGSTDTTADIDFSSVNSRLPDGGGIIKDYNILLPDRSLAPAVI
jgi:hypothetical protein